METVRRQPKLTVLSTVREPLSSRFVSLDSLLQLLPRHHKLVIIIILNVTR